METFIDSNSPRSQLSVEQLPRGVVKFPAHIVEALARERVKFKSDIFTENYARKALESQTLLWYYEGLPVAYKPLPDGIEVLGVGWEETAKYSAYPADANLRVVQP